MLNLVISLLLGLGNEAKMHLRAGLPNIALPATLSDATREDLLLHLVPGWHQNGTQLTLLKWPDKQLFENSEMITVPSSIKNGTQLANDKVPTTDKKGAKLSKLNTAEYQEHMRFYFEKVPSSVEKSANLIAKKSLYLISIVALCSTVAKIENLMEWMNYKKNKVSENYILFHFNERD